MELYKDNGNTANSVKMIFLSGFYRRACQMSTVGIRVLRNFFFRFQMIHQGLLHMLLLSVFKCLQIAIYSIGKGPLFARRDEVRERVISLLFYR